MKKILTMILIISILIGLNSDIGSRDIKVRSNQMYTGSLKEYMDEFFFDIENLLQETKSDIEITQEKEVKIANIKNEIIKLKEEVEQIKTKLENAKEEINTLDDNAFDYQEIKTIALYSVSGRDIKLSEGFSISENEQNKHNMIWRNIKDIIPEDYMNYLVEYEICTDGEGGVMGQTYALDYQNKQWAISIDVNDVFKNFGRFNLEELDKTIIHELAHIVTLNYGEFERKTIFPSTYKAEEGYLREDSYLNLFYNRFWKEIYYDLKDAIKKDEESESYDNQVAFYELNKNRFVSSYASINPEEDFAEVFMAFVKEDKPKDNASIVNQKILFMYEFEELKKIRDYIRSNI